MRYEIKITPVAKPRMTRRDKWEKRKCTTRYWAYKDELNIAWKQLKIPPIGNRIKSLEFHLPIPKSGKNLEGKIHTKRPDLDNLIKAFLDALCKEDGHVAEINAGKYWSYEPKIIYEC